ncbi:MAG TPA: head-tail connector protein [Allosphingosinicella sp.]|nr:head-tail connector protein [Allosphingosinicella sp.]
MRYSIRTVGPLAPAEVIPPVIDLAEAKAHLRVDFDDDDDLISAYLAAAQDHVERHTSQVLTPREMELSLHGFPAASSGRCGSQDIVIPREPVTAITAISYADADGVAAELDEADWRWSEGAADLVLPTYGTSWPTAYDERGSVRVRFEAGYEEGLAPASLTAAVKLMLGHLYLNRESVVTGTIATELPAGIAALCAPYRRVML